MPRHDRHRCHLVQGLRLVRHGVGYACRMVDLAMRQELSAMMAATRDYSS